MLVDGFLLQTWLVQVVLAWSAAIGQEPEVLSDATLWVCVRDEGGAPVEGAQVRAEKPESDRSHRWRIAVRREPRVTDANGCLDVPIREGEHQVTVSAFPYYAETFTASARTGTHSEVVLRRYAVRPQTIRVWTE